VNRLTLLTCLAGTIACSALGADQRIAFERGDSVYISNREASLVRKIADGTFPAISPDAKALAFSTVEATGGSYIRRIATVDVATSVRHLFDAVPGQNSYYSAWSPDGQWISFTMRSDDQWNLGVIKNDGSEFRIVKKGDQNAVTLFSPCWARDGKSLFCHDMTSIYQLGLDGAVIQQWKIGTIIPNGSMSGDGRINVSPDGHRLLLSVEMDETYDRPDWDGPVPALWSFDVNTHASVRLTSKNLFAWDGCWLDNSNLLFVSQRAGEKQASIYQTNGKDVKRLIENARRPSVSRR
jgi:TolB protein